MIEVVVIILLAISCPILTGMYVVRNRKEVADAGDELHAAISALGHGFAKSLGMYRLLNWLTRHIPARWDQ